MDAWSKVGPTSNLCLNKQKGKRGRKNKKIIFFSHSFDKTRERVRKERKVLPSLYNLRRSGGPNPSSQDFKFIYSTRAMLGYRQHAVSPKISGLEKKS